MAEAPKQPDPLRFDHSEYDVTFCCEILCCGGTKLILGEEEAVLVRKACFGMCQSKKRGPYGELGTVDSHSCCCLYGFGAGSLMPNSEQGGAQFPGCGCSYGKVDEVVAELKKRQQLRGDQAKVRMAETTVKSLEDLHGKVDLIMEHLQLTPSAHKMERAEYEVVDKEAEAAEAEA